MEAILMICLIKRLYTAKRLGKSEQIDLRAWHPYENLDLMNLCVCGCVWSNWWRGDTRRSPKATGHRAGSSILQICSIDSFNVLSSFFVVFKKFGDHSVPSNYHAITLLPLLGKVFEAFINAEVVKYLTS